MTQTQFNEELLAFLDASPTPFHATKSIEHALKAAGWTEWSEGDVWKPAPGKKAYVKRNDSSIVAFRLGSGAVADQGFRIIGAHTDSPCLRVKPNPEVEACGLLKLGVEVYGGVLLSTWFDRDLSLAGRVSFLTTTGTVRSALVDFERPIAVLPNLAIHLNREVNENRSINKQVEMPPILCHADGETKVRDLLAEELVKSGEQDIGEIVDFELSFYDTQTPAIVGMRDEFISSARLDNLLSCFIGMKALLEAGDDATGVLVCNDHEEIGSASTSGAQGNLLKSVLERLTGSSETLARAVHRSMFVSSDNAHAVHPNYPERHDAKHAPVLGRGPALKINTNQRYATNSETAAVFARCCEKADVGFQRFVSRCDMPCGSTIGPITATEIGIKTVDVGVPTFAMHSAREMASVADPHAMYRALCEFYRLPKLTE